MDARGEPVVIAGAGPVGLALALGLSHHGVRAVVLEEDDDLARASRAPVVLARSLEILRAWGVVDRFLAAGTFLGAVDVWVVGEHRPEARIDLSTAAARTAFPGGLVLPQERTERLLYEALRERGLADVRFGARLSSFRQDDAGVDVEVVTRRGDLEVLRGSFLVGCDGAHSTVRRELGLSLSGKTYPSRFLLCDVRVEDERDALPWPRLSRRASGFAFGLRMEEALWRVVATLSPADDESDAISPPRLAALVEEVLGPGPFEERWRDVFRIHMRRSPRFVVGRVVLCGDAAHINSPAGGQGMNAGLLDAHNLAWKLARATRGGDVDALLSSYDLERSGEVAARIERFTDLLTRVALLERPRARGAIARIASRLAGGEAVMRRAAPRLLMLDADYRASPLVGGRHPLAGTRPDDAIVLDERGAPTRVLDLASRDAALLVFASTDEARAAAERLARVPSLTVLAVLPQGERPRPGAVVDESGALRRRWSVREGAAVLLRPDGHVGLVATNPAAPAVARALGHRMLDDDRAAYEPVATT